jgi:hypothetical protein
MSVTFRDMANNKINKHQWIGGCSHLSCSVPEYAWFAAACYPNCWLPKVD